MSMVVEMRECRICPCTDFGSAPACTIPVAQEVRSERQLALNPRWFAAGLINRFVATGGKLFVGFVKSLNCQ